MSTKHILIIKEYNSQTSMSIKIQINKQVEVQLQFKNEGKEYCAHLFESFEIYLFLGSQVSLLSIKATCKMYEKIRINLNNKYCWSRSNLCMSLMSYSPLKITELSKE